MIKEKIKIKVKRRIKNFVFFFKKKFNATKNIDNPYGILSIKQRLHGLCPSTNSI